MKLSDGGDAGVQEPRNGYGTKNGQSEGRHVKRLMNYTPHKLLMYLPPDGEPLELPQRGNVRLVERHEPGGLFANGLPVTLLSYEQSDALPEPSDDVVLIVSQLVVNAYPGRTDLAFPAGLQRNEQGDIIGFKYLARPAPNPSSNNGG